MSKKSNTDNMRVLRGLSTDAPNRILNDEEIFRAVDTGGWYLGGQNGGRAAAIVTSQTNPLTGLSEKITAGSEDFIRPGSKTSVDVCVYDASPAGCMAAMSAARGGASVVLVSPNGRVGGLMTGGLARTDYRGFQPRMGWNVLSQEFQRRCAAYYGRTLSEHGAVPTSPYSAECKVAEAVFRDMLNEYGVPVLRNFRITSASNQAGRIAHITLENRLQPNQQIRVHARVYIDASYTGDLLMRSGASWTYGREANATYGETTNGVRSPTGVGTAVSVYVTPGDAGSGFLPRVLADAAPAAGTADTGLQAYGHRLIVTDVESNKRAFPEPDNYNPLEYELMGRRIAESPASFQTMDTVFLKTPLPNGKWDLNNQGTTSLDYTGGNVGFVTGTYAERDVINQNHINYTLGLLKFLREDSRIPAALKNELSAFGFCKDEFVNDNATGMSPELYIREAARMVGEYVMTEANFTKAAVASDWVSLATYPLDSHGVSLRHNAGMARVEGAFTGLSTPTTFYGISYRSMLPKMWECANMLVCGNGISASHVAFSGLRLEHNLMGLGEAAGVAAALHCTQGTPLHALAGENVRKIVSNGHFDPARTLVASAPTTNGTVTLTGTWTQRTDKGPTFVGAGLQSDQNGTKGGRKIRFEPAFGAAGWYLIRLSCPCDTSGMGQFKVVVNHSNGTETFYLEGKNGEVFFRPIGKWHFPSSGGYIEVENSGNPAVAGSESGFLLVDAVAWEPMT